MSAQLSRCFRAYNGHNFVPVGAIKFYGNIKNFFIPRAEKFFIMGRRVKQHRTLKLGIGGPDLALIRAVVLPQAVGRRAGQNGLAYAQGETDFIDLCFHKVCDRGNINTAITR